MPCLICDYIDCIHIDTFSCECRKDVLTVEDFMDAPGDDPQCYESYRNAHEYQQEYWIQVVEKGQHYRKKMKGKQIEANGFVLFTDERVPHRKLWESENTPTVNCTEEKSGCLFTLRDAFTHKEALLKCIARVPPVMELPESPKEEA